MEYANEPRGYSDPRMNTPRQNLEPLGRHTVDDTSGTPRRHDVVAQAKMTNDSQWLRSYPELFLG